MTLTMTSDETTITEGLAKIGEAISDEINGIATAPPKPILQKLKDQGLTNHASNILVAYCRENDMPLERLRNIGVHELARIARSTIVPIGF